MKRSHIRCKVFFLLAAAIVLLLISLLAPYLVPNNPYETNPVAIRFPPSVRYPFGTDNLGRCVFSRLLIGGRTSVVASLILVTLCFAAGTGLGAMCGYYGGLFDQVLMHVMDVILSIPQMVLAIAVAGIMGGGIKSAMLALGISSWIVFARLARALVLAEKTRDYVYAARLSGRSGVSILFGEILPGITGPLIVHGAMQMAAVMTGLAGLSFLGLGVQVPEAEWGSMIREARAYIQLSPWPVLFPAGAILLHVFVFGLLGDAIRDLLNMEERKFE